MNNQKHQAPDSFDSLMKEAFLNLDPEDPKNASLFEAVSLQVMQPKQPVLSPFQKLKHMLSQRNFLYTFLAVTGMISMIIFYTIIHSSPPTTASGIFSRHQEAIQTEANSSSPSTLPEANNQDQRSTNMQAFGDKEPSHASTPPHTVQDTGVVGNLPGITGPLPSSASQHPALDDTTGTFPRLTEKEIKENNKNKLLMVDMLYRMNKRKYPQLPAASINDHGTMVTLQSFRMANSEVCNLEYRTFLVDLLIQGRKADYLKAKPARQLWETETGLEGMKVLTDKYFTDSHYDDYPVVNVSREGAEMYCAWLTDEGRKAGAEKVNPLVHVRLPQDVEWIYAAQGGNKESTFAWNSVKQKDGGQKVMNKKGYFLANFCLKKYTGSVDSIAPGKTNVFRKAYTTAGLVTGLQTYTAPIYSYNPNDYGLYCMSGNVAEMIVVHNTGKPGTKGGGWNSDEKHLLINAEDEYGGKTGPSPYIGFRVVLSAP